MNQTHGDKVTKFLDEYIDLCRKHGLVLVEQNGNLLGVDIFLESDVRDIRAARVGDDV